MQRINFVEAEIMMRLADEHLDLAIEALRAEASISLPETASKSDARRDRQARESTEPPAQRKVKIVGLKARLTASVIELFRGSERARDAIQILGVALIALTSRSAACSIADLDLQQALFTHYGDPLPPQLQAEPAQPVTPTAPTTTNDGAANQVVPGPGAPSSTQNATTTEKAARANPPEPLHYRDGPSRLIGFAFPVLVMASFFGGIGACLSGLFSFTLQGRVPNEYEGWFRTLIRPVIGIASGFLAVVILRSGL